MLMDLLDDATPSLAAIAARAKLSPETLKSYAQGRRVPNASARRKLATALREMADVLRDGARKIEAITDEPRGGQS